MSLFKVYSEYKPCGDQPEAINKLSEGIRSKFNGQTLLGVTGSGKTFTIANVIEQVQKPTLIIAHNKTLAAQLYSEFKEFFPNNAVEYFVSYYDYYQPEAYIAATDTYIEKDSAINDEIDKLRHSATASLLERRDVIVVASVSCIYGLGDPEDYAHQVVSLRPGMIKDRDLVVRDLVDIQYERNNIDLQRGRFRVNGDVIELRPVDSEKLIRIEFFGDEVEKIAEVDPLTGEILGTRMHVAIFPASHYTTSREKMNAAILKIQAELQQRLAEFKAEDKLVEAQRLEQRTMYDIEMMQEIGFCQGIENYSRHISGREPGSSPFVLLDYFPKDFLTVIDESHVTVSQISGMYKGDRARKESLVNYGFRLPSAFDNRPLRFEEFDKKVGQVIYVSATPAEYERKKSVQIVEQIIRPTGLVDPEIVVKPVKGQIDDLIGEIKEQVDKNFRVLVTTLTKKMAEDLTEYLSDMELKVKYLHSDIDTLERVEIIRDLRLGVFNVLVGINLLREGLDLPEVSLVAILDADKEGFLRSATSLIQTIGRAARNASGKVIMYADVVTSSMNIAINETNRRRKIQTDYNLKNKIIPKSIQKGIRDRIEAMKFNENPAEYVVNFKKEQDDLEREDLINKLTEEMTKAAAALQFERAAVLRDKIEKLRDSET